MGEILALRAAGPGGGLRCLKERPAGDVDLQIVRTVPENLYDFAPRGDFRIIEAYLRALRSAQRLVYLEDQFLWSPEITSILADNLRRPPTDEFRVVIMLPAKADNGKDDTRGQLGVLAQAERAQNRFLATTIRRARETPATVCTCTRRSGSSMTAGSRSALRNLNAHSVSNDNEVNLVTCNATLARETRLRLWAAHLERPTDQIDTTPAPSSSNSGAR